MQEKDRRYIYNGSPPSGSSGYAIRQNRKGTRRRISTSSLLLSMFGAGIAIIVYVNNILTVNALAKEVRELRQKLQEVQNVNGRLRAEISTKSAVDQIAREASKLLGLTYAKEQPIPFPIDETVRGGKK